VSSNGTTTTVYPDSGAESKRINHRGDEKRIENAREVFWPEVVTGGVILADFCADSPEWLQ